MRCSVNINKTSWLLGVIIEWQRQEKNPWYWQRLNQVAAILINEGEQSTIEELIRRRILMLIRPSATPWALELLTNILNVLRTGRRPQSPRELILHVIEAWVERDGVEKARENSELQLVKTMPSMIADQGNNSLEIEYKGVLIEMRNTFSWFLGRTRDA
jgi:hypothetical protein